MAEPDVPELEEDRRKKEKERRGAGAALASGGPGGSTLATGGQAAAGQGLAAAARSGGVASRLVTGFGRSVYQNFIGGPLDFARLLISLGPRAAMKPLGLALLKAAAVSAALYATTEIIDWATYRLYPRSERTLRGAAFGSEKRRSSPVPKGALPAEGLFAALPGVFTTHKGLLTGGSPAPDASVLKEGKPPETAAGADAGEQAGAAASPGAGSDEGGDAAAWAEALAEAQGAGAGGAGGFQKLPSLGGGGFVSGGSVGRGGPGARGGGRPGGSGRTAGAAGGTLTAFRAAAPRRALVAGNRMNRALPPGVNERQRLVGTTIISNEATRIAGNEASFTHAAAPFDQNTIGAQAIPDPIGLRGGSPATSGGPGGGGVRPRPSTNNGGNPTRFDPRDGNRDILRPDLGGIDDWVENTPTTPPPGTNDSLYISLVETSRELTQSGRDNLTRADQKKAWGEYWAPIAQGALLLCTAFNPACSIKWQRVLAAANAAILLARALFREGRRELEEAQDVSDEIDRTWGQGQNSEAIDYCIRQARRREGCEFRGDWTRAQACGYKPQMTYTELQTFSICMGENGPGLQMPNWWYPEGNIDPNDRNRVCRAIYPDAVLRDTGDPSRPYLCVRPGGRPPP